MSMPKAGRLSLARVSREVDCGSGVGEQRRQDCVQPPSAISVGWTVFSQTLRIDWLGVREFRVSTSGLVSFQYYECIQLKAQSAGTKRCSSGNTAAWSSLGSRVRGWAQISANMTKVFRCFPQPL